MFAVSVSQKLITSVSPRCSKSPLRTRSSIRLPAFRHKVPEKLPRILTNRSVQRQTGALGISYSPKYVVPGQVKVIPDSERLLSSKEARIGMSQESPISIFCKYKELETTTNRHKCFTPRLRRLPRVSTSANASKIALLKRMKEKQL
jgi:hypothetical protein